MSLIKQGEMVAARRRMYFRAVDGLDGVTPVTNVVNAGYVSRNGGAPIPSTGTVKAVSISGAPGLHYYEATAAEADTLGDLIFIPSDLAIAPTQAVALVVEGDPLAGGLTVPDVAAGVWDASDRTLTESVWNADDRNQVLWSAGVAADSGAAIEGALTPERLAKLDRDLAEKGDSGALDPATLEAGVQAGLTAQGFTAELAGGLRRSAVFSGAMGRWVRSGNTITLYDGPTVVGTITLTEADGRVASATAG